MPMSNNLDGVPKVELVTITPAIAQQMLSGNTKNRNVRETKVAEITGAMVRGEYDGLNGETIKFGPWRAGHGNPFGMLLDGQHRLRAVVRSGCSVQMFVAYNVNPQAQETIDIGTKRSVADMLQIRGGVGVTDAKNTASGLRLLYRYSTTRDIRATPPNETPQQLLTFYEKHEGITHSANEARTLHDVLIPAFATMFHYLFHSVDTADANDFLGRLAAGEGLYKEDPIWHYRKQMVERKSKPLDKKISRRNIGALGIKAWNMYRQGEEVNKLFVFRAGGSQRERFPLVDGLDETFFEDTNKAD